jgi:predicted LPLAT superfamily acyltransferase
MTAIPLWRTQRERGSRVLMQLIATLTLRVGRSVGRLLLYPICAYFLVFSRRARRASGDYLGRVYGRTPTWSERFRHYHCFARQILDRAHLLAKGLDGFDYAVEGVEILESAVAKRRGVFLLGAHLGSFEMMRVLAHVHSPVRLRVLMHEANAEKLTSVFASLNSDLPRQVIALGRPETMLEVRDALRAGDVVSLLADRALSGDRVRICEFLGAPAPFAEGPFVLAGTLGVPVLLFSALQIEGDRYRIRIEPFADRIDISRGARDVELARACTRYANWLEERCREAPYNWFNFYDFWDVQR